MVEPTRYGPFALEMILGCEDGALVRNRLRGATELLSSDVVRLLAACRGFRTLDEHAAIASAELDLTESQRPRVRRALEQLVAAGLLVSRSIVEAACRRDDQGQGSPGPVRIGAIGIPTRGRPASLARCVDSILHHLHAFERTIPLVVSDDSRSPAARAEIRALLSARRAEGSIRVVDHEARSRYMLQMGQLDPSLLEPLRFALFGLDSEASATTGATRNVLLLDTVGDAFVSFDDDIVLRAAAGPPAVRGLAVGSSLALEGWFFPDYDSAEGFATPVDGDVLDAYEKLLGHTVSACARRLAAGAGELDVDDADGSVLHDPRVVAVSAGVLGDSGTSSLNWLGFATGATRARLLASQATYDVCLTRQVLSVAPRFTVTCAPFLMSYALGLDNRDGLPPFLPCGRNADGLFGAMLRASASLYIGHLPLALVHRPPEPRRFSAEDRRSPAPLRLADTMQALLPTDGPFAHDLARVTRRCGQRLIDIGTLPPAEFRTTFELLVARWIGQRVARLRSQLRSSGNQPSYWAQDVATLAERAREGIRRGSGVVPTDVGSAPETVWPTIQRLVHAYGVLLDRWPAIVDAARHLATRGVRISEPVVG